MEIRRCNQNQGSHASSTAPFPVRPCYFHIHARGDISSPLRHIRTKFFLSHKGETLGIFDTRNPEHTRPVRSGLEIDGLRITNIIADSELLEVQMSSSVISGAETRV